MTYNHWTKIDDGAEGAWALDVWLKTLEIISRHEGEKVYDSNSHIYNELKRELPDLTWSSVESGIFRPYFRDFSKPWTITNTANFDETFTLLPQGRELVNDETKLASFWINFLKTYTEDEERPFAEICAAFNSTNSALSLNQIYWIIVRNFRVKHNSELNFNIDTSTDIPAVAKRRLILMLQFIERTGAITKIGSGSKQRWKKWDSKILSSISDIKKIAPNKLLVHKALSKPFLLLAGISGTGKSRFVREQAKFHPQNDNFCLVAVRPDWHEPSDLLGYTSRLSGKATYVATDVLKFMVTAWKALHSEGLQLVGSSENKERTELRCDTDFLEQLPPYWLCLDEMNLAPVEQYFADYLSLIETRDWEYPGNGNCVYSCDALLSASVFTGLEQDAQNELASNLGLKAIKPGEEDHELWQHFLNHGIAIPPNLIVAGTVNMDETTHGFSRKVIDRAMSFDFGEFFPNDFDDYFSGRISHVPLTFPRHSSGKEAIGKNDAEVSIEFLKTVNSVLKGSPFELAYRALNELLLAVHCHGTPKPGADLQAVWDDFLMQKVLPRIEGDADKLQSNGDHNLLTHLREVLEVQLADIWADDKIRTDFYRLENDQPARTACRSRIKLQWMLDRLNSSGFTSFWP